jgi:hypothetical protein
MNRKEQNNRLVGSGMVGGSALPSMGVSQFRGGRPAGGKKMLGRTQKLADPMADEEREAMMMGHHLGEHLRSLHGGAFHTHFVRGMNGMTSGPIEGGGAHESGCEGGSKKSVRNAIARHMPFARGSAAEKKKHLAMFYKEVGDSDLVGHLQTLLGEEKIPEMRGILEKHLKHATGKTVKGLNKSKLGEDMFHSESEGASGGARTGRYEGMGMAEVPPMMRGGRPSGGARKPNARAAIVKKVMAEHGMKMIEASKYVKAHGLY